MNTEIYFGGYTKRIFNEHPLIGYKELKEEIEKELNEEVEKLLLADRENIKNTYEPIYQYTLGDFGYHELYK